VKINTSTRAGSKNKIANGIPMFPVLPVAVLKESRLAVLSLQIRLKMPKDVKARIELKIKKKLGRNKTEASSFTLIVAMSTIKGARINNNIFAIVSLLQFKIRVLKRPSMMLK